MRQGNAVQTERELGNEIRKKTHERTEKMIQLGEATYKEIRSGSSEDEQINNLHEQLFKIDMSIVEMKQKVAAIRAQSEKQICECGNEIAEGDLFCGECGSKVVKEEPLDEENSKGCKTCQHQVPITALFCPACGHLAD